MVSVGMRGRERTDRMRASTRYRFVRKRIFARERRLLEGRAM